MKTPYAFFFLLFSLSAPLLSPAQNMDAGQYHVLSVCPGNVPNSWAYNLYGQLGDGTTTNNAMPAAVSGLSGITAVAAGRDYSLFLKNDGTVWACGRNLWGQLGDGSTTQQNTAVQVSVLTGITAMAGAKSGYHSLFLKSDSTVWACGYNSKGQLGQGSSNSNPNPTPVQVPGLSGITAIACGEEFSLFLKNDGTVWSCGYNNYGQLGDGTTGNQDTPVQVSGLTGIIAIDAGAYHSLFLKNDGTVWACGQNSDGQLGDGNTNTTANSTPVQAASLSGITAIVCGTYHSLFLKNDGTAWACGRNSSGQLGNGTTTAQSTPVQVSGVSGIMEMAAGSVFSFFVKTDGSVWASGANLYGQLGNGSPTLTESTPIAGSFICSLANTVIEPGATAALSVYPVPASGNITIERTQATAGAACTIMNAFGQTVLQTQLPANSTTLDIRSLGAGIYFLRVQETGNTAPAQVVRLVVN